MSDSPAHGASASTLSSRNWSRALARLAALLRGSNVLSAQETLDFACTFLNEAIDLTSVVVLHDRAARPLVWCAVTADEPTRARALAEAEIALAQRTSASRADQPDRFGHEPEGRAAACAVTLSLSVPLLGVMRVEGAAPIRLVEITFLRYAVILLSLALDHCQDGVAIGEAGALRGHASSGREEPSSTWSHDLELARSLAIEVERSSVSNAEEIEALRVARGTTLEVLGLLQSLTAPRSRA